MANAIWIVPPESKGGFDGQMMGLEYRDLNLLLTGLLHETPDLRLESYYSRGAQFDIAKLIGIYERYARARRTGRVGERAKARDEEEHIWVNGIVLTHFLCDSKIQTTIDLATKIGQDGYLQLPETPSERPRCGWMKPDTPTLEIDPRQPHDGTHRLVWRGKT